MSQDRYRLVLLPVAESEVEEASRSYELHDVGLGDEFVLTFSATTAVLRHSPFQYQKVFGETRRVLLRRFPYAVFYAIQDSDVVILACRHTARNPQRWQTRGGSFHRPRGLG